MKLSDITVQQFISLSQAEEVFKDDENRLAAEISKIFFPGKEIKMKDFTKFHGELTQALSQEPKFIQRFKHKGIEYGFIPNLEELTTGEFIDLDTYQKDKENYHRMLSILYRPIVKSYGDLYKIEEYKGTQNAKIMLEVSCEILLGSLNFFFRLLEIIQNDSLTYIQRKIVE